MTTIALRLSALAARLESACAALAPSAPRLLATLFGFYTLLTVFRTPVTLARLFRLMRSGGGGVKDEDFLGFNVTDALIRPAYRRISTNFINHGRYGYTWGDAFGLTMRERFGNSSVTYRLLHALGSRAVSLAGYALFSAAILLSTGQAFGAPFAVAATLLFMATPVLVFSYTSGGGKTETLWYGPIAAALWTAFAGHTLAAALLWSVLVACNLMGPVLTAAVTGPALLVWSIQDGTLPDLLLGVAPGVALVLYRFATPGAAYIAKTLTYLRISSHDVGAMLNGGKAAAKPWPVLDEWLGPGAVTATLLYGAWSNQDPAAALLGVTGFAAYYVNRRVFFLSDFQSFDLLFLAIGVAYSTATANLGCLAITFLGAHRMRDNDFCILPLAETMRKLTDRGLKEARDRWSFLLRTALDLTDAFPPVHAIARPRLPSLDQFWAGIPDHARVAVETIRTPSPLRQAYPDNWMRAFWFLTDDVFPARNIELATKEFTFTLEPELMLARLAHLNAAASPPERYNETCAGAGISRIIAFSRATMTMLEANGWRAVRAFDFNDMEPAMRGLLQVNVPGMVLLERAGGDFGIVTPDTGWSRHRNTLTIQATAGTTYSIRYRRFPEFVARQGGRRLPIEPWAPFDDVPTLVFMRITAVEDGPLELRYVDHPGRALVNRLLARARPAPVRPVRVQ